MIRNTPTSRICQNCKGRGEVTVSHRSGDPQMDREATCGDCFGSGWLDLPERDSLVLMRNIRRLYGARTSTYQHRRTLAMHPVRLP